MQIVIPIKQVPDTSKVKLDPESGTIIRNPADAVMNPLDLYALETALRFKETYGGKITIVSMGPSSALRMLKEALAMGCDEAFLLSDKAFAGADTWATSYTLSTAIRQSLSYDLILTGERATDGDTGQVGPGIAAWLDIPIATYVARIVSFDGKRLEVARLIEEGYQRVSIPLPCVLTVVKEIAIPRLPTLKGILRARASEIPIRTKESFSFRPEYLGLKGSPTRVVKIDTPQITRHGKTVWVKNPEDLSKAAVEFLNFLQQRNLY
ncbi:MAG: electron transfer flavoprotein subunit beta/FixA family protein [Spirochaetes bacterium]|nr:electron transfer flavoprotein subunit beta/FixA family protein [Spirochaetota bacterium]